MVLTADHVIKGIAPADLCFFLPAPGSLEYQETQDRLANGTCGRIWPVGNLPIRAIQRDPESDLATLFIDKLPSVQEQRPAVCVTATAIKPCDSGRIRRDTGLSFRTYEPSPRPSRCPDCH